MGNYTIVVGLMCNHKIRSIFHTDIFTFTLPNIPYSWKCEIAHQTHTHAHTHTFISTHYTLTKRQQKRAAQLRFKIIFHIISENSVVQVGRAKTMNQMGISWRWHDHVCCLHRHYTHSLLFLLAVFSCLPCSIVVKLRVYFTDDENYSNVVPFAKIHEQINSFERLNL